MASSGEEVHTARLNENLSVWSVMNSITVKEEANEIDSGRSQKRQRSVWEMVLMRFITAQVGNL